MEVVSNAYRWASSCRVPRRQQVARDRILPGRPARVLPTPDVPPRESWLCFIAHSDSWDRSKVGQKGKTTIISTAPWCEPSPGPRAPVPSTCTPHLISDMLFRAHTHQAEPNTDLAWVNAARYGM